MKKNSYRKYTQIYTFLGYFRIPLWLFHKPEDDNQIFILKIRVRFILHIKILLLITSNNRKNKHIWTETAYQCCKTSYIIKIYRPNLCKIIIFFDFLSLGSSSFIVVTYIFSAFLNQNNSF